MEKLEKLTRDELIALNQKIGAERADAEAGFKARQLAVTAEIDKRDAEARLEAALDGLAPDVRQAVLAGLAAKEG